MTRHGEIVTVATAQNERGFVLVTSLIFLVIVTLLAVTAINSSTLQERMASNQRDKSQARQGSDAALRAAERIFESDAFRVYRPAGDCYAPAGANPGCGNGGGINILREGAVFSDSSSVEQFLDPDLWASQRQRSSAYDIEAADGNNANMSARFFVEEMRSAFTPRDLNATTAATADGTTTYRITARARGANPAATSVTQSYYLKDY